MYLVRQEVREKMDPPNAPNPLILMPKINLWKQCMVLQIKLQGPVVQNQAQGPVVHQAQDPANNNAQVGQNVPVQPPQQLAPVQPVPTGLVVPAPQIFYQN